MVDVLFLPMVWWMSGVVDIWCGGCPVWWMSGVVDVLFYSWCGGCLVWSMSGVVDVCVVDVVQSYFAGYFFEEYRSFTLMAQSASRVS